MSKRLCLTVEELDYFIEGLPEHPAMLGSSTLAQSIARCAREPRYWYIVCCLPKRGPEAFVYPDLKRIEVNPMTWRLVFDNIK